MAINDENAANAKSPDTGVPVSDFKKTADLVNNWYQSYYLWNQTVMANSVMNSRLVNNQPRALGVTYTFHSRPTHQQQQHRQHSQQVPNGQQQGSVYKVPSLARRFAAECIDSFYIQCFKIVLALLVINYTDLISEETLTFETLSFLEDIVSEDMNNIRLPLELLVLEIVYVLISVVFETHSLYVKGYTPGKYLLNMRVIHCTEITELATPNHVRVQPGTRLSFKNILIRTSLKNFSIIFLFPTIVFFLLPAFVENGQTTYDKLSDSIVVENP